MSSTVFLYRLRWARLTYLCMATMLRVHIEYTNTAFPVHHRMHYIIRYHMLHLLYRSCSQKNQAEELKSLKTTSLCYSNAKSTPKILLTFSKVEKTKVENFDFVPLLSSFFFFLLPQNKSKVYGLCEGLTYQTTALLTCYKPTCFELHVSYKWRLMAWKLSLSGLVFSYVLFLAFYQIIVWTWHV